MSRSWAARSKDPLWQQIFSNVGLVDELSQATLDELRGQHAQAPSGSSQPPPQPKPDEEMSPDKPGPVPSRVAGCRPARLNASAQKAGVQESEPRFVRAGTNPKQPKKRKSSGTKTASKDPQAAAAAPQILEDDEEEDEDDDLDPGEDCNHY